MPASIVHADPGDLNFSKLAYVFWGAFYLAGVIAHLTVYFLINTYFFTGRKRSQPRFFMVIFCLFYPVTLALTYFFFRVFAGGS